MIEVTIPDSTPVVDRIALRMRQQIADAHQAAVTADSHEADAVVWFITTTYRNLLDQYPPE